MINSKMITVALLLATAPSAFADNTGTATDGINTFEKLFGVTEGKRRNHTKGFCFSATLSPKNQNIQQYSNSNLFTENAQVIGRLSHKGGKYLAADNKPGEYGMGLSITTASNENHPDVDEHFRLFPCCDP